MGEPLSVASVPGSGNRRELLLAQVTDRVATARPELLREQVELVVLRCSGDLDGVVHPEALPELLERLVLQRLADSGSYRYLNHGVGADLRRDERGVDRMTIDFRDAASRLADAVRSAHGRPDTEMGLSAVTALAVELGLADHAGVTVRVGRGDFETLCATDGVVSALDRVQCQFQEGPCVQAVYDNDVLVSEDVATDSRWTQWGLRAATRGIASVISVNLYTEGDSMGALNLYRTEPGQLTEDDLEAARLVGAHAAIILAHRRDGQHLWKAIDARHRIGQAQGLLMERYQVTPEKAFAVLRRLSQDSNTELHLIADALLRTGQLPDPEASPPAAGLKTRCTPQ